MLFIPIDMLREKVIHDLKCSDVFAVIKDTTTDLSKLEELAFVVRFITTKGHIQVCLLAFQVTSNASGKGLFHTFAGVCEKYELN